MPLHKDFILRRVLALTVASFETHRCGQEQQELAREAMALLDRLVTTTD